MKKNTLVDLSSEEQFSINQIKKEHILFGLLGELHHFHFQNSKEYQNISKTIFPNSNSIKSLNDFPFLPVSLFKNYELKSISNENIYKVLTSSGTTGQVPSKIYLDKKTAQFQSQTLSKIMQKVLGNQRLPMLIVDSKAVLKDRKSFSARGAGILGMSIFGKKHQYLLNENYEIDLDSLRQFIEQFNGQKILIFGFTFMVWKYLFSEINFDIDLSQAILIHSGGWKKMKDLEVDNSTFKQKFQSKFGLEKIYNFYGMVEQVGSIFLENEMGFLHCPNFSDILIRNPKDFSIQPVGEPGLIQVLSVLPWSYPGHSILTEDIGICMGEDDLAWKGKYFKILGRAKKAELRGCSDVFSN